MDIEVDQVEGGSGPGSGPAGVPAAPEGVVDFALDESGAGEDSVPIVAHERTDPTQLRRALVCEQAGLLEELAGPEPDPTAPASEGLTRDQRRVLSYWRAGVLRATLGKGNAPRQVRYGLSSRAPARPVDSRRVVPLRDGNKPTIMHMGKLVRLAALLPRAGERVWEFDLFAAQANACYELALAHDVPAPTLGYYLANREDVLRQVIQEYSPGRKLLDRGDAKALVAKTQNPPGGAWAEHPPSWVGHGILLALWKESREITRRTGVLAHQTYPQWERELARLAMRFAAGRADFEVLLIVYDAIYASCSDAAASEFRELVARWGREKHRGLMRCTAEDKTRAQAEARAALNAQFDRVLRDIDGASSAPADWVVEDLEVNDASPHLPPVHVDEGVLVLEAPMGTGKSRVIMDTILRHWPAQADIVSQATAPYTHDPKRWRHPRILFVVCRVTLMDNHIAALERRVAEMPPDRRPMLNIARYDRRDPDMGDRVSMSGECAAFCTFESLGRWVPDRRWFDCVVLDEATQLLCSMACVETNGPKLRANRARLVDLCRGAHLTIVACADFGYCKPATLALVEEVRYPDAPVRHIRVVDKRGLPPVEVFVGPGSEARLEEKHLEQLLAGDRTWAFHCSASRGRERTAAMAAGASLPAGELLFLEGISDDAEKRRVARDFTQCLERARLAGATSCASVGVDGASSVPVAGAFMYRSAWGGPSAREAVQGIGRARRVTGSIYLACPRLPVACDEPAVTSAFLRERLAALDMVGEQVDYAQAFALAERAVDFDSEVIAILRRKGFKIKYRLPEEQGGERGPKRKREPLEKHADRVYDRYWENPDAPEFEEARDLIKSFVDKTTAQKTAGDVVCACRNLETRPEGLGLGGLKRALRHAENAAYLLNALHWSPTTPNGQPQVRRDVWAQIFEKVLGCSPEVLRKPEPVQLPADLAARAAGNAELVKGAFWPGATVTREGRAPIRPDRPLQALKAMLENLLGVRLKDGRLDPSKAVAAILAVYREPARRDDPK